MVESGANRRVFGDCTILEVDIGLTALEVLRIEMLNERKIDVILIDYMMTNLNGPEAVKKMREEMGFAGMVVGVTGNALPDDLAYFKAHGANCVITKPLTNAKLMKAVLGN